MFRLTTLISAAALLAGCAHAPAALDGQAGAIAPFHARSAGARPLAAVVGDNRGTELTDYVVPFGVLAQSGVADVLAVATDAGPLHTFTDLGQPSLHIAPDATIAQFDARWPQGADYVVVPATRDTPGLRRWIAAQAGKGATIVSICNGALVVAHSGVMDGRRATAHWSTEGERLSTLPAIHWVRNARYVADGNWISSAGVSAAIPASVALVAAIAGHDRAESLARELGVADWSARHDSAAFHPRWGDNLAALGTTVYANGWLHGIERVGLPVATGVDEVALALTIDAWSSTGRSLAVVVAAGQEPVRTRHGLVLLPDATPALEKMLPALDNTLAGHALDQALGAIAARYGRTNAYGVALVLEYPGWHD